MEMFEKNKIDPLLPILSCESSVSKKENLNKNRLSYCEKFSS